MPHHGTSWQRTAAHTHSFPPDAWRALVRLPGQVAVAASAVPASTPASPLQRGRTGRERDGVAEALAGLEAIAAGRACGSTLVRDVVSAIFLEDGDAVDSRRADVFTACALAGAVLARGAWLADAEAYRHWIEAIAARVCQAANSDAVFDTGGPALAPPQWRFVSQLSSAFVR